MPTHPATQLLDARGYTLAPDGALTSSLPRETARALVADLEAAGAEASWAPDNDDPTLAWVYVTVPEV